MQFLRQLSNGRLRKTEILIDLASFFIVSKPSKTNATAAKTQLNSDSTLFIATNSS
jgi:hypothetical protein